MSVVSRGEQDSESDDENKVGPGVGGFVPAPDPTMLPSLSGAVQTETHYPQNGEWCQNCELLKQDIRGLRTDHALNYKALKEKIINTDMLIKKYNDKCQQFDTQSKKLDEITANMEKFQRDRDAVQCQLQATLADLEPLRRTTAKAEKEKTKNITVIRDLQDKINAFQATALQHRQLLQHHEREMAAVTQQQKQSQQTVRDLQAAKKKQDSTLKKLQTDMETKKTELSQAKKNSVSLQQANQKLQDLVAYYEEVLADWDLQHLMKKKKLNSRRSLADTAAAPGIKEESSTDKRAAEDSVVFEQQAEALLKPSLNVLQPELHGSQHSVPDPQDSVPDPQDSVRDSQDSVRDPQPLVRDPQRSVHDVQRAVRDPQHSGCDPQHLVREPQQQQSAAAKGKETDSFLEYDLEMIFVDLGVERRRGNGEDSHYIFRPISPALSPLPASPAPPAGDAWDEEDISDILGDDGQQQTPDPTTPKSCAHSKSRRKTPKRRNSIRTQLLKTVVSNAKGRDTSADDGAVKQKGANIQEKLQGKSTIPFQSFKGEKSVCESIKCEKTEILDAEHRQSRVVGNLDSSDSDTEDKSKISPKVSPRLSLRRSPRLSKSPIDRDIQFRSVNSDDGFLKPLLPAGRRQQRLRSMSSDSNSPPPQTPETATFTATRSNSLPASLTQTGLQNKELNSSQNQNSENTGLQTSEKTVKPARRCKTRSLSRQLSLHDETNDVLDGSCDKPSCGSETTDLETLPSAPVAVLPSRKPKEKQLTKQGTQSFEVGMNSLPENDEESKSGSKAVFYIPESDHSTSESDRDETMSHSDTAKTSEVSKETSDRDKSDQTGVETSDRDKSDRTGVETSDRDKSDQTGVETSDRDKNNQTAVEMSDKEKNDQTAVETLDKEKSIQTAVETSDRDKSDQTAEETSDKDKSNKTAVETADRDKNNQTAVEMSDKEKNDQTTVETLDKEKSIQTAVETSDRDKSDQTAEETSDKDKSNQTAVETADRDNSNKIDMETSDRDKNNKTAVETPDEDKNNQTAVETSDKDKSNQTAMETSDNSDMTAMETLDKDINNQTAVETSDRDKSDQTAVETADRVKNNQKAVETSDRNKSNQTAAETSDRDNSNKTAMGTTDNEKRNEPLVDRDENSVSVMKESTSQSCSSEVLHNVDIPSDYTGNPLSPLLNVDDLAKPLSPLPPTPPRAVILIPGPAGSVTLRPRPIAAEDRHSASATVDTQPAARRKRRSQDSGLDVTHAKKLSAADDIIKPHPGLSTQPSSRGQHTPEPLEYQLNCLLRETSISVETVAGRLLAIKPAVTSGTLATAIVQILVASESCQLEVLYNKCREQGVSQGLRQDCTLTAQESRLICCLQLLQQENHLTAVKETVLQVATSTLLSGQKTSLPTSLIRVFTALCRQQGDVERARVLCYDAVYQGIDNYPLLLLTVASVWPLALHDQTPAVKNPALQVIQYAVITKSPQGDQTMHDEVIKCMQYLCSWSETECPVTSNQLLTSFLQELQRESLDISPKHSVLHELEKSIQLLSKVEGWSWTMTTVIRGRLWPLLDHWLRKKTAAAAARPQVGHRLVSNILHIICALLWQCQPDDYSSSADVTTETFTLLRDLLVNTDVSVEVQTAAIETLLPLAVFQPETITTFCCQWMEQHKHEQKSISGQTLDKVRQMLRYYNR